VPLRVLIVPDKFKGSLTAHDAAEAIAAGWRKARPNDRIETLPMSDGGDGFGAVLGELMDAKSRHTRTVDAVRKPLRGLWRQSKDGRTAIIDSAAIIGLATLPRGKFHPFQLDSFGLGMVMRAAAERGAGRGIIGIGGSATNDGGFGMAQALGWRFFKKGGEEIGEWWQLHELAEVRRPVSPLSWKVTVAVDVANPLLGPKGCSRIYGPQKGLRPQDFALAEKSLRRLVAVMRAQHGIDCSRIPGAGAAGGLGFGLMAFAGATTKSGFDVFADYAGLSKQIAAADIVITGEGCIDHQTYMGKGVGQVGLMCRKLSVPCLAVAGSILEPETARRLFAHSRALLEVASLKSAQAQPARHLRRLAMEIAVKISE
jgi:glycerate 2-kinase